MNFANTTLLPCLNVRNLGVTFDHLLTWESHLSELTKRCFGLLSGLCHLRHHIPRPVIVVLVTALVLSQVRYCISVFGNGSKKTLHRLQKILNFAAKVIYGRQKYDYASDLRQQLGWMTSEQMCSYHTLSLLHKIIRSGEPEALAGMFHTNASLRERSTRQDSLLYVPRSRTECGRRRFCVQAPDSYNVLPPDSSAIHAELPYLPEAISM